MKPENLGIANLNSLLKRAEIDLDAEQIADILWLTIQIGEVEEISLPETPVEDSQTVTETKTQTPPDTQSTLSPIKPTPSPPAASAHLPNSPESHSSDYLPNSPENQSPQKSENQPPKKTVSEGIPFQAPAAPALRKPLALARALRPLMRKVPSQTQAVIDEEETVTQIVEKGIWTPVFQPAPERWLELALVVEESPSTVIWQEIIAEFQRLTELQGAFRDVRTWSLKTDDDEVIKLFPKCNFSVNKQRSRSPKELLDPAGRRLILLISDCISPIWRKGEINRLLKRWSNTGPVAILQLLPERIWGRTALGSGFPIQLSALVPGVANSQLVVEGLPVWEEVDVANALNLPVVTLEPDSLKQWSQVVAGVGSTQTAGILWDLSLLASLSQTASTAQNELSAEELVKRFRTTASPTARRLAGLMAAVPVSLPVVYLLQETLLPESRQVHVAEVFMSGLLQPISHRQKSNVGAKHLEDNLSVKPKIHKPNASPSSPSSPEVQYEFIEGVRELLLDSVPTPDVETVLEAVSQYIARKLGISIKNFMALLSPYCQWDKATEEKIVPFAQITTQVLQRLGGEYAALAKQLERSSRQSSEVSTSFQIPALQTFEFNVATVELEAETETSPEINLQPFDFEVATIEVKQTGAGKELIIHRHQQQAWQFIEDLGNGVQLEMVAIPGGNFIMGSPEDELERSCSESPQHRVKVKPFLMGKYPVTQAQWNAVAALPQINRELKLKVYRLYYLQGVDRPVEPVSWYEAVEFCDRLCRYANRDRLSQKTGRQYRLPSEAEWEYACRAGTTTPFHFGETITPELANYNGNYIYGNGVKGENRSETTDVGSFGLANDFGLYDMHGNVWEWCADSWHSSYRGAPTDGSVWEGDDQHQFQRLLRGGSWRSKPVLCRSAYRSKNNAGGRVNLKVGFRVVCAAAWTL